MMAECDHCGSHVSQQFFRVFSNNDGDLQGCPRCMSGASIRNGDATTPSNGDDGRGPGSAD